MEKVLQQFIDVFLEDPVKAYVLPDISQELYTALEEVDYEFVAKQEPLIQDVELYLTSFGLDSTENSFRKLLRVIREHFHIETFSDKLFVGLLCAYANKILNGKETWKSLSCRKLRLKLLLLVQDTMMVGIV